MSDVPCQQAGQVRQASRFGDLVRFTHGVRAVLPHEVRRLFPRHRQLHLGRLRRRGGGGVVYRIVVVQERGRRRRKEEVGGYVSLESISTVQPFRDGVTKIHLTETASICELGTIVIAWQRERERG